MKPVCIAVREKTIRCHSKGRAAFAMVGAISTIKKKLMLCEFQVVFRGCLRMFGLMAMRPFLALL
jgi:hypothetical protein